MSLVESLQCYEAWYFGRLQLAAAAAALSAACSGVLLGSVDPRILGVVFLSTYAVYAIDDVMDIRRDEQRWPRLTMIRRARIIVWAITIPGTLLASLWLAYSSSHLLLFMLGGLGLLSIGYCAFSALERRMAKAPGWRRLVVVSGAWTLVCVLTPVVGAQFPFTIQVASVLAFVWVLVFIMVAIWNANESYAAAIVASPTPPYESIGFSLQTRRRLQFLTAVSAFLVLSGVLFDWFPWKNLLAAAGSVVLWGALATWEGVRFDRRRFNDFLVGATSLGSLGVMTAYLIR